MEKIAFISNGTFIYWSSIILTLAAAAAIAAFVALYLNKSGNSLAISIAVPTSVVLSMVFSRLIHWYCRADSYESLGAAMTDYSTGGYALMGVFAACLLVALLLRLVKMVKNLPEMLDCMALAGGLGIAVGRLASFYNASDRGMLVSDSAGLPFAWQVTNAVTGVVETRMATFLLQAIVTGVIAAVLLVIYLGARVGKKPMRDGDVFLLFAASYGSSQILLDSTRYDSLFMRSNGFISIVQILGLVGLVLAIVVFSVYAVRNKGMRPYLVSLWVAILAMMGIAGYMEYHVQRHGDQALFAYTVMGIALVTLVVLTAVMRALGLTNNNQEVRIEPDNNVSRSEETERRTLCFLKRRENKLPDCSSKWFGGILKTACVALLVALSGAFLVFALLGGLWCRTNAARTTDSALMDKFDMYMTNEISNALDGVLSVEKVYWLSDNDLVAPEPNQECFGIADDASSLQWLLDDAAELLDGQDTYFTTETKVWDQSDVMYYLDETIFAVTWKEQLGGCVYTFSEVKIADGSQFRRFLAGGEYGSDKQYVTTEMAASVNAVVASSGDFYKYRRQGVIVYDGTVQRVDGDYVDTCYVDDKGDLLFSYRGEITTMEQAQQFVDENNIRFSIAFGPVLIDEGKRVVPWGYALGEIDDFFPRAALCQRDELHYIIVVCNREGGYNNTTTIWGFCDKVEKLGCKKAYTLDGGQTAVIAMNDQLINAVHFGTQRQISDIFYFATALPGGG